MLSVNYNTNPSNFSVNRPFFKPNFVNGNTSNINFSVNTSGGVDPPPPLPPFKEFLQLQSSDYPVFSVGFDETPLNLSGNFRELEVGYDIPSNTMRLHSSRQGTSGVFKGNVKDLQTELYDCPFSLTDPALGSWEGTTPVTNFAQVTVMGADIFLTDVRAYATITSPDKEDLGYLISNEAFDLSSQEVDYLLSPNVGRDRIVQIRRLTPGSPVAKVQPYYTMRRIDGTGEVLFALTSYADNFYCSSSPNGWYSPGLDYNRQLGNIDLKGLTAPVILLMVKFL
jgi:hypothetical protein